MVGWLIKYYNFCINSNSKFLVEAKALNNNLDDNKMIIEKLNYCTNKGVPILIITNGNLYKILETSSIILILLNMQLYF